MAKPIARKRRYDNAREVLPAAFTRAFDIDGIEGHRGFALLEAYRATRTADSFRAAAEHFLPIVFNVARYMKRRHKDQFSIDSTEELVSDGTIGLLNAIRSERECPTFESFRRRALMMTIQAMRQEKRVRIDFRRGANPKNALSRRIRRAYLRETGRLPTSAELNDRLAAMVANVGIETPYRTFKFSEMGPDDFDFASTLAAREKCAADPDAEERHREMMSLARRSLTRAEREIFDMAIEGHGAKEIADTLKVDSLALRRRLYGILWELRSRVDLADALGVVAEKCTASCRKRAPWKHPTRLVG